MGQLEFDFQALWLQCLSSFCYPVAAWDVCISKMKESLWWQYATKLKDFFPSVVASKTSVEILSVIICGHVSWGRQAQGRVFRTGLEQTTLVTCPLGQICRWSPSANWQSWEGMVEHKGFGLLMDAIMMVMIIIISFRVFGKPSWRNDIKTCYIPRRMFCVWP